ncbi:TFIIB-type zinc ribbon-containing protein [Cellulomonas soli]
MLCPVDQARLVMADRQGVEIDYCPVCRGVWLDRGELDKILERSVGAGAAAASPASGYGQAAPSGYDPRRDDRRDDRRPYDDRAAHDSRGDDPRRKKKRESWLEDLFDF